VGFIIENKTSKYTNILTEDLDSIISKITPKNQHDAIDFSVVMGKELL